MDRLTDASKPPKTIRPWEQPPKNTKSILVGEKQKSLFPKSNFLGYTDEDMQSLARIIEKDLGEPPGSLEFWDPL